MTEPPHAMEKTLENHSCFLKRQKAETHRGGDRQQQRDDGGSHFVYVRRRALASPVRGRLLYTGPGGCGQGLGEGWQGCARRERQDEIMRKMDPIVVQFDRRIETMSSEWEAKAGTLGRVEARENEEKAPWCDTGKRQKRLTQCKL